MVLAAMLAMMVALSSPAFAQDITITQGDEVEFNAVAQNITGSIGDITQTQTVTSTAVAADDSVALNDASQTQEVVIVQANWVGNDFHWWWWF